VHHALRVDVGEALHDLAEHAPRELAVDGRGEGRASRTWRSVRGQNSIWMYRNVSASFLPSPPSPSPSPSPPPHPSGGVPERAPALQRW